MENTNNEENNFCTFYLVRHGETEFNVEGRFQGHMDSRLTELGIQQAKDLALKLRDLDFDFIFSSDLLRAKRTAEILKLDRDLMVESSELLRERSYGHFEGRSQSEYREKFKDKIEQLKNLSDKERWQFKASDDIETDEEISNRFLIKIREIALAYPGKRVLVVSHGGIIRTFLLKIGFADRDNLRAGSIKNSAYVKLISDGNNFIVKETDGINITEN